MANLLLQSRFDLSEFLPPLSVVEPMCRRGIPTDAKGDLPSHDHQQHRLPMGVQEVGEKLFGLFWYWSRHYLGVTVRMWKIRYRVAAFQCGEVNWNTVLLDGGSEMGPVN